MLYIFPEVDWFAEYKKERVEREALRQLEEKVRRKAKREARIKRMKEEHGSTRWRTKRKVSLVKYYLESIYCCLPVSLKIMIFVF